MASLRTSSLPRFVQRAACPSGGLALEPAQAVETLRVFIRFIGPMVLLAGD